MKKHDPIKKKIIFLMIFFCNFHNLFATSENLLALLPSSTKSVTTPKKQPDNNLKSLITDLTLQQQNAAYQQALAILNDQGLQQSYDENMFKVNLLLSEITAEMISLNITKSTNALKKVSIDQLLQLLMPSTPKVSQSQPMQVLSDLLNLLPTQSLSSSVTVKSNNENLLLSLVSKAPATTPAQQKSKQDLLSLLQSPALTRAAQPVNQKTSNNLLSLLPAG